MAMPNLGKTFPPPPPGDFLKIFFNKHDTQKKKLQNLAWHNPQGVWGWWFNQT
jgi:hypothetical protein